MPRTRQHFGPRASSLLERPPLGADQFRLRLVFLTGLAMSLFILLIAFLDDNQLVTAVCGAIALIFFVLLLRLPDRRRRPLVF